MERTFSQDERIKRAEEIYLRRQNMRNRTQRVTVNTNNEPKNIKLFKKLALQIIICIAIYYIFYLLNTTNYSFSDDTLSKAKELISNDFDFYRIYTVVVENVNSYLYPEENVETKDEEINNENQEEKQENENVNDEEGVNQTEVGVTEESETARIRNEYEFILPLNRSNFIGVWR